MVMTKNSEKNSLRAKQLWDRFEKSGSIQAYLRFRQARQDAKSPESGRKAAPKAADAKESGKTSPKRALSRGAAKRD
jgi:hypothetical protein